MPAASTVAARPSGHMAWNSTLTCVLLVALAAAGNLAVHWYELINNDVAFLAWASGEVMGPSVYGVDIYEVNPPLCIMIYAPAALLAPYIGFDPALKLWVTFLGCMSVAGVWQSAGKDLRRPVVIALILFFIIGSPKQLGQREQIAFLLCAPYVAGYCERRGWSIASGVMAGVGFAIKPYFLIPLLLVFATRRRIRTEEWAIAATGLTYAVVLAVCFQPYVLEFLPAARATYWAYHVDPGAMGLRAGLILASTIPLALAAAAQPASYGYLAATLGFVLAAILQFKGFGYHLTPAWGFLFLYLTALLFNPRRFATIVAALLLITAAVTVCLPAYPIFITEPARKARLAALLDEINDSASFLSLSTFSYPGFPTALYTHSKYAGLGIGEIFLPAATHESPEAPDRSKLAVRLALGQAIRELQRKPDLVIVPPVTAAGAQEGQGPADVLSWYRRDGEFEALWQDYEFSTDIRGYRIFRRKALAASAATSRSPLEADLAEVAAAFLVAEGLGDALERE